MNDRDIEAALEKLPLPDSERRTLLLIAKPPGKLLFIMAILVTINAVLMLTFSYGDFSKLRLPPASEQPIAAREAYNVAIGQRGFYMGALQGFCALAFGVMYYHQRRNSRAIRALVSSSTAPKVS